MRIRILKCDGAVEPYLHTKVLGTFHNALASVGENDLTAAEQLAEAVTFYLYHNGPSHTLSSDQIHLLIQSVLSSTGFPEAAEALNKHRLQRKLKRKRIVVVDMPQKENAQEALDATWSKSRIVQHLTEKQKLDRLTARTIAATVEEKVLGMGISRIRTSLIRELVLEDTEAILRAEKQLQTVL